MIKPSMTAGRLNREEAVQAQAGRPCSFLAIGGWCHCSEILVHEQAILNYWTDPLRPHIRKPIPQPGAWDWSGARKIVSQSGLTPQLLLVLEPLAALPLPHLVCLQEKSALLHQIPLQAPSVVLADLAPNPFPGFCGVG